LARGLVTALVVAVVFGVLLGRFALAGRDDRVTPAPAPTPVGGHTAETRATRLQAQLRADPDNPVLLTSLADAYLVRARETADPTYYDKAGQALERSRALAPDAVATLTASAFLDLARHNFDEALRHATRAHELNPDAPDPLAAMFDANVELGRYDEAMTTVDEMLRRRPALAGYARLSYIRELRGDTDGAIAAMIQAAEAGAGSPDDRAYVETLLGDLHLSQGDLERAEAAYERSMRDRAQYVPAQVGLARVAAARSQLRDAATVLREAVVRLPLPATAALLGDVLLASEQPAPAMEQYELVRTIESLNGASGVDVDLELARFEADHLGDPGANPDTTVAKAQAALAARPTIYAEDTLAWALRGTGRAADALPHALAATRLGTEDALLWYHLAAIEADLGRVADARTHLATAMTVNPYLTVRDLPDAKALAQRLGAMA
jgi:tetratricopeptide (TPR) repeat protein